MKTLYQIEKETIIDRCNNFKCLSKSADTLDIKLITLINKLHEYGLWDKYKHKVLI